MAPVAGDFTADANEALSLSLVRAKDDRASLTTREAYEGFHPTFTYPIYGEDEKIYGYNDLLIDLKFASGSLTQYLHVSYSSRLPPSSAVDDVEGKLSADFIPPGYHTSESSFLEAVEQDALTFKPYGELIYSYSRPASTLFSRKSRHDSEDASSSSRVSIKQVLTPEDEEVVEFEVYHCTWSTPGFREYHRRMQLFIILYIEGGTFLNEEDDVWHFVVLYEKRKRRHSPDISTYHFVGYSSLYPFYCFPEKQRMRLSQFVILPPYQQEGHGSALYSTIYTHLVLPHSSIAELTVEDPAEAFEDLRDRNDLKMLMGNEKFMKEAFGSLSAFSSTSLEGGGTGGKVAKDKESTRSKNENGHGNGNEENGNGKGKGHGYHPYARKGRKLDKLAGEKGDKAASLVVPGKIGPPGDKAWLERWRVELKLAGRQFHRLIEMLILKHLVSTGGDSHSGAVKAFRLQVKERLFRFNFEVLMQLDKKERQEKLEETYRNVREDYMRILNMIH